METKEGIIIRALSGFYYVEAAGSVTECRAKGSFRNKKMSPLVGDRVTIELTDDGKGVVSEIHDRKNCLSRPPVANIDKLFIVSSVVMPKPNLFVIDKLTAFSVLADIQPVIVFSKNDLGPADEYVGVYRKAGFTVIECSSENGNGLDEIRNQVRGCTVAFTGNSGVGKSSIINALLPGINLETNEISMKLGRGKHTTRCVSLYECCGGFIADTPGFSSFEIENGTDYIPKDILPECFPEFLPFINDCFFASDCAHDRDRGCAVRKAVEDGIIPEERHENYLRMYAEVKNKKEWEKKK